ncbi:MFS transporter [Lysinibacillus sp. NPDC059133]|uniref:MFS transporter n=1 Tax=Lysinibacillus sp. NPDC059133 TaxID=3346737 RepID=UPI0036C1AA30
METLNENASDQSIRFKKAVPIILLLFIFTLIVNNSFRIISTDLAKEFGLSPSVVSWQVTLASLVIGIGAVVYASLTDTISVRTLLSIGIILMCVGSLMGYIFQHSFIMIVISRVIQSAGLASAETLYVVSVTKYLPVHEQKKFFGFSTMGFAISQVLGMMAGGFISTYIHWTVLFLIPLLTLIILPFILKLLPKEKMKKGRIDVVGLFLVACIAGSLIMYVSEFNWIYLITFIVAICFFILFISKSDKGFIDITFFKNKLFLKVIAITFPLYTLQLAYIFMFPFLFEKLYGLSLDTISLLFIPVYVIAAAIGATSGKIAKFLSTEQCIYIAITLITASFLVGGFFVNSSEVILVICMTFLAGSFALMYAPWFDTLVGAVPEEKSGTAIGFYNLSFNIAASIGIAYVASMMSSKALKGGWLDYLSTGNEALYSNILIILGLISLICMGFYWLLIARGTTNTTITKD